MPDISLNQYLQPENSLVTAGDIDSNYLFPFNYERGLITRTFMGSASIGSAQIIDASITNAKIGTAAIGTANIGTLTFNQISGGTANLGGTANGNGVLSVSRSDGTEVVRLDNTGLTINQGSITINNSSGSSIIDSNGLVSYNSFFTDSAGVVDPFDATSATTTSTTLVDMPNTTLGTVTINRTTAILTMLTCDIGISDSSNVASAWIFIGGDVNDIQEVRIRTRSTTSLTLTTHNLRLITAGTPPTDYVIKVKWLTTGGTATVWNRQITRMLLGK